ncbi:cytochrome P450 [Actinoplanes subtropicus]|uniref:cytochrome P450 n=1 Tax=Actinoplanes subtropicus TaxID=543632 RepID=UPI0004C38417|nr:cytochrome P450 [Actinoplanes subtropicus]
MADPTTVRSYPFGPIHALEIDPTYFWLQDHEPLARVKLPYGEEGWLLTRYDDVRTALGDPRFSLAQATVRDVPRLTPQRYGGILTDQDPPDHTRLRRLVAKAFTARRVEQLRDRAERITDELLDEMVKGGQPADLAQALAVPLPGLMVCELIGVPYADRDQFRDWVGAWMSVTALSPEQRGDYIGRLAGYVATLAEQRRQTPTDDLLGALVTAQEEDDRLTAEEVVQLTLVILAAGYESTASQIVNFTYALLTHPDQLALLRSRPDLMPGAVEELMRWVPLLAAADVLPRYALVDVELSGGTVPAGEPVLLAKHAANRDPRRYEDPDRLDLTRDAQGELGFGHGAHHCLGAPLARLDIQTALTALLARFPELRLAVPEDRIKWKSGMAVRGPVALPVAW